MVTEMMARMKAHTPTKMSRPTTFMRVNVVMAPSPNWAAAAMPAASANSDVPIHAPEAPPDKPRARQTTGSRNTMIVAQITTIEMDTDTCSFLAFTAEPMAMEADTPQIEPPVASVAANGFSSLNRREAQK